MTDWVHCNKCFLRYRSDIKFYVTTCGHLKCKFCVSKMANGNQCLICNSVCEMALLSNNLKPDLQCFFRPGIEAIQKADNVCSFQLNNASSLLKHMTAKYTAAKAELAKGYKIYQEAKKEQHRLKMLLKSTREGLPHATRAQLHDMGSTSVMSGHMSSIGLNFTPRSNASNSFLQFKNLDPTFMPRNQQANAARMMMYRRHPSVMNSSTTSSFPGMQEASPASFAAPGFPDLSTPGLPSSRHGSSISMSNFHLGPSNKPR